jgi:hypothetical protein
MNTCDTCKFWFATVMNPKDGTADCDMVDTIQRDKASMVEIDVQVHDDSGLWVKLMTGPKFGCVHHQKKEKE